MIFDAQTNSKYIARLVTSVLLINLFVIVLACFFLNQCRTQYKQLAEAKTKNLSQVLAQNVSGSIDKTNLVLLSVVDEVEK